MLTTERSRNVGDSAGQACPVCGSAIGSETTCARCDWTLRSGHLLGALTARLQASFDLGIKTAQRRHDLLSVARAAGFPHRGDDAMLGRLLRFVRGAPPSAAELAELRNAPSVMAPPVADTEDEWWPERAGLHIEIDDSGVTATRFEQDGSGTVYEIAEGDFWAWTTLLPGLPSELDEQRLYLAGGATGSGTMSGIGATLAKTMPQDTASGEVLMVRCSVPDWPVAEQAVDLLSRRNASARVLAAASSAERTRSDSLGTGRVTAFCAARTEDPDAILLAAGDAVGNVIVQPMGRKAVTAPLHEGRVTAIDVASDGSLVASGGKDGAVYVWPLSPSGRPRVIASHEQWVNTVRVRGGMVFSIGDDDRLRRSPIDTASGATGSTQVIHLATSASSAMAVSSDAGVVAVGGTDGQVRMWDGHTMKRRNTLSVGMAVRGIELDPAGQLLAVIVENGSVALFECSGGRRLADLVLPDGEITAIAFGTNQDLAFGDDAGWVRLWRRQDGAHVVVGRHRTAVRGISIAGPVISVGGTGLVRAWDRRSSNVHQRLRTEAM